jgi:charged multivesicular body protein 1
MARKLDEALFDLKFSAKQMRKESEKLAKDETKEKTLAAKALAKGQIEVARTHGVNAIQSKNLSLQMLQNSSKIDGCAKRLEHAMRLNQVSKTMESVVQSIGTGLVTPSRFHFQLSSHFIHFELLSHYLRARCRRAA